MAALRDAIAGQAGRPAPVGVIEATLVVSLAGVAAYSASQWGRLALLPPVVLALVVVVRRWRTLPMWLVTFEMTLGGWGHAIDVAGLPIRHLLLATCLAGWAFNKVLDGDWRIRGGPYAAAALVVVGYTAIAVAVSAALGHPSAYEDGLTIGFLLLLFPLADYALRPGGPLALLRALLLSILALSTLQIALTLGITVGLVNGDAAAAVFHHRLGAVDRYGIGGPFWRVYFVGAVYYQIAILVVAAALLEGVTLIGRRLDRVLLAAAGLALLFSYTRGFWLTCAAGLGLLGLVIGPRARVRWASAAIAGGCAVTLLITFTNNVMVDIFVVRFLRLFDPDRDASVALRLDLYPRLLDRIAERPIFGYGYGLPVENQLYFENSYLYYLLKVGLVGLLVLAAGWFLLLRDGLRLARGAPDRDVRAIAAGLLVSIVSMLAVSSINPFINSAVGLFFQAVAAAVLFALSRGVPARRPA